MKKSTIRADAKNGKIQKCEDICRTYSRIQALMIDILENDNDIISFECNVRLKGVADDLYSTDIVAKKADGSTMVRECVWRINLCKPSYAKLMDMKDENHTLIY